MLFCGGQDRPSEQVLSSGESSRVEQYFKIHRRRLVQVVRPGDNAQDRGVFRGGENSGQPEVNARRTGERRLLSGIARRRLREEQPTLCEGAAPCMA